MRQKRNKNKIKLSASSKGLKVLALTLTVFWILGLLFPIYWMLVSSFKDATVQYQDPPEFGISTPLKYTMYLEYDGDVTENVMYTEANILLWQMHSHVGSKISRSEVISIVNGEPVMSTSLSRAEYHMGKHYIWTKSIIQPEDVIRSIDVIKERGCVDVETENIHLPEIQLENSYTDEMTTAYTGAENLTGAIAKTTYSNSWSNLLDNYLIAWDYPRRLGLEGGLLQPISNTVFVAVVSYTLIVLTSATAAYAISKLLPHGLKHKVMMVVMASGMVPATLTLIPKYMVIQQLGMNNTLWAVILPTAASFGTMLIFKGTFDSYPDSVIEAARLDGANEMQIFLQMALPSSKALLGYVAITTFANCWNTYFWPKMVLKDVKNYTVAMVLDVLLNGSGSSPDYSVTLALGFMISIPTLIIYALFQKSLTYGIDYSGLKG